MKTNAERYKLKRLTDTNGLNSGDILGDQCVLGSNSVPYDYYKYKIGKIINDVTITLVCGTYYPISSFFKIPTKESLKLIKSRNHPLTDLFLPDKKDEEII